MKLFKNADKLITILDGGTTIKKYTCSICGYIYDPSSGDPENGVAAGTEFNDIPGDWVCPVCGAAKDLFEEEK